MTRRSIFKAAAGVICAPIAPHPAHGTPVDTPVDTFVDTFVDDDARHLKLHINKAVELCYLDGRMPRWTFVNGQWEKVPS